MEEVDISVILTAYNRKEYIKDAIDSLSNQTLDNKRFEVLCITNFYDYDQYCRNKIRNLKIIHPETSNWGEWIYLATINAKGKILTFLDDDDIYNKFRLERILNIFEKYSSQCIYYINNFLVYKAKNLANNSNTSDYPIYLIESRNFREFRKLLKFRGFFNNSRIAISKKLFLDNLNLIRNIDAVIFDAFLGSLAYESDCKILIDTCPLTIIRNMPYSLSKPTENYLNRALKMSDFILRYIAKSREIKAYLKYGKLYTNYLLRKIHKKECKKVDLNIKDFIDILLIKDIKALYLFLYNILFC